MASTLVKRIDTIKITNARIGLDENILTFITSEGAVVLEFSQNDFDYLMEKIKHYRNRKSVRKSQLKFRQKRKKQNEA